MAIYCYKCDCGIKEERRNISDADMHYYCKVCAKIKVRQEVCGTGAPLLYSSSSAGTRACDKDIKLKD